MQTPSISVTECHQNEGRLPVVTSTDLGLHEMIVIFLDMQCCSFSVTHLHMIISVTIYVCLISGNHDAR